MFKSFKLDLTCYDLSEKATSADATNVFPSTTKVIFTGCDPQHSVVVFVSERTASVIELSPLISVWFWAVDDDPISTLVISPAPDDVRTVDHLYVNAFVSVSSSKSAEEVDFTSKECVGVRRFVTNTQTNATAPTVNTISKTTATTGLIAFLCLL